MLPVSYCFAIGNKTGRQDYSIAISTKQDWLISWDASGAENVQGEVQQKLDLFANEKLKAALKARDIVAGIASEEEDEIVVFEGCEHAKYVVLMDPLDGSSNIDNVSVGTIFSIYRRVTPVGTPVTEEDFSSLVTNRLRQVTWYTAPLPCWFTPPDAVFTPLLTILRWAFSVCARNGCASRRKAKPTPSTKETTLSFRTG